MTKSIRSFLLVLLLFILFREPLFRWCVQYDCSSSIPIPRISDEKLLELISQEVVYLVDDGPAEWAEVAQQLTARQLAFRPSANNSHPNIVWNSGKAHCVGYAALMGAVLQNIAGQLGKENVLEITQCRGDIYLFGFLRLTGPTRPAFFRDHDYIQVRFVADDVTQSYDPSVYDYLRIRFVD